MGWKFYSVKMKERCRVGWHIPYHAQSKEPRGGFQQWIMVDPIWKQGLILGNGTIRPMTRHMIWHFLEATNSIRNGVLIPILFTKQGSPPIIPWDSLISRGLQFRFMVLETKSVCRIIIGWISRPSLPQKRMRAENLNRNGCLAFIIYTVEKMRPLLILGGTKTPAKMKPYAPPYLVLFLLSPIILNFSTMKKYIVLFIVLFFQMSCEDVIDVVTPSEPPRLIVDALFRVDVTQEFIPVVVKVSTTNNFFEDLPVTSLENIVIISQVMNEEGTVMSSGTSNLAEETPGSGIYVPDPTFDADQRISTSATESDILYTLVMEHEGRRYAAQTKYVPAVPIDRLEQGTGTLFSGDETEIVVTFTDEPDQDNFYVFDFNFGEYLVTEDEFYKGQEFQFSYFYDQTFEVGREIEISILGADLSFYNYMDQLIEQSGDLAGPFQTPAVTVRGNLFDVTGLDNIDVVDNVERPNAFPLGYFAIVQEIKQTITIE